MCLLRLAFVLWFLVFGLVPDAVSERLQRDKIFLEITNNEDNLGEHSLDVLVEGVKRYQTRLPAGDAPIYVYVCRTFAEFEALGARRDMPRVEGFAQSREGIMVVRAPEMLRPGADYDSILRHELLHLLLARNTNPDFVPRWLNEGIAMMLSKEVPWGNFFRLALMNSSGRLLRYNELYFAFAAPGNETEFGDAYVQALSMTNFLREQLGDEAFWSLVRDLREVSFPEALERRLGKTPIEFYRDWRDSLWSGTLFSWIVSGFVSFQVAAFLVVLVYLRKRRRGQEVVRRWEQEDEEDDIVLPWELEGREPPGPWEEEDDDR